VGRVALVSQPGWSSCNHCILRSSLMSRQPPHADLSALLLKLPGARLAQPPRYGPLLTTLVGGCMLGAYLGQDCTCRPGVGNFSHPFQRGTCTEHQQGIACCTSHCVHAYENTVQHRRPTGCQPPPQAAWPQEINLSLTMHLRQHPPPPLCRCRCWLLTCWSLGPPPGRRAGTCAGAT